MSELRVTIAQIRRFGNYRDGVTWLNSNARELSTDLIILPENWVGIKVLSEDEFNDYIGLLKDLARGINALIIGGAAYVNTDGKNTSICPMVNGRGLINYSEKIYPSKATGERMEISAGRRLGIVELGNWRIGCIICVDAVYPELVRRIAMHGADLITNPSSISADRAQLWRSLGLIRAFENSTYFASAMGTGYRYPDGRDVLGGGFVASPNGELTLSIELGAEGLFTTVLNRYELEYARARRGYINDLRDSSLINSIVLEIVRA
ncbi:carbon-nitrogen hydrolase family protein [Vulcanisaeta souniana]|uniref:Nitrilase/cyanide hydratase and apolipoprotein N-acyltransferase n=1 Tax=Vulcanisaeta souniana JCM 11219 TaxID=1293586 RepID=A0A830E4J1_9CREN|nr:carbon-nitrogen hydrolase family protein [Vulcanisaeta souniana]BDR92850.1 nitrilase/cyanide hydratase and apolipoprotein N-acyltransferase [Vulcanisaeta souniana JCM 11219]GGI81655.1 nitrilase/cyanide hydratase and apolipoprotein N-acyltransferase [Vulcanisaeta souniana JCM 11219]